MADMKLFIELLARSTGLKRELNDSERGFQRFGSVAKREMASISQFSGSLQGKLAGLGVTIGVLQQFRMSAQLDKDLTQIGQTAGAGSKMVTLLRSDLFRMGKESGQDLDSLKGGFDSLVQSGLNMREATSTLDGINIAMAVTGAKAETLSGALTVAGTHFGFDLAKPGQALAMLDKMTVAGRLGNAELGMLSATFSRVGVSAKSAGMSYDKTLAFIEALSLAEKNPERLGTLATSSLRMFTDGRYMMKTQQGLGMKNLFFDKNGARRDVVEVFGDIQKKYKILKTDQQRAGLIYKAFGEMDTETKTGIQLMLEGQSLVKAREFLGTIDKAGGTLKKDFDEATRNLITQGGRLKNTMRDAADGFIKPINENMSTWIQFMLDKKENGGLELNGKKIAGGAVAITAGTYALSRLGNSLVGDWAKKRVGTMGLSTAAGVAEGKVLQAATGVTPVFVTNWPAGGMPGAAPQIPVDPSKLVSKMDKALPYLVTGAMYSLPVAAVSAPFISKMIGDKARENGWGTQTIGRDSREYEVMGIGGRRSQQSNQIKVDVHFDEMARAFTRVNSMNTAVEVDNSKRGDFFKALMTTEAM